MKLFRNIVAASLLALPAASAFAQVCTPVPLVGCLTAEKSALTLRNDPIDSKDRLIWKWQKGEPGTPEQFDDPTSTTSYLLCTYSGAVATLRSGGEVVVGPSNVRWAPKRGGYKYKDSAASDDGITGINLRADPLPSRSSAMVKGKGLNLPDQTLALVSSDFPVVVQLVNSSTTFCLESTLMEIDIKRNDANQLKLKSQ